MREPKESCRDLAERHGVDADRFSDDEVSAVHGLEQSWAAMRLGTRSKLTRLVNGPSWGLLDLMLTRVYRHAESSLVLLAVGQPAAAEVVSRTVMESALNLRYILYGNPLERINVYFSSYIGEERKQSRQWQRAAEALTGEARSLNERAIERKGQVLDWEEEAPRSAAEDAGVVYQIGAQWPNVAERFKSIGDELSYRTIYAAMCSQTHSDAEDTINAFIIGCIGDMRLKQQLANETVRFSRLMVYSDIEHFLAAMVQHAQHFHMPKIAKEITEYLIFIHSFSRHLAESIDKLRP